MNTASRAAVLTLLAAAALALSPSAALAASAPLTPASSSAAAKPTPGVPVPTTSTPANRPIPVTVTTPVKIDNGTRWWENPLLTAAVGAALGFGASFLSSKSQRNHDATVRTQDRERQDAYAQASGRLERFEKDLALAEQQARDSDDTARSLKVLTALLAAAEPPRPEIADLVVYPRSMKDARVAQRADKVRQLLDRYRACGAVDREAVALELRRTVDEATDPVSAEAAARTEDFRVLNTDGRRQAYDDAETLRSTPTQTVH